MAEDVRYEMILGGVDKFEAAIKSMKSHTDMLESSMHHLKSMVMELVGAYAGFEILKESFKEFEEHKVAVATLTQMYDNNRDSVGMTIEQLKELAEQQEKITGVHSEVTMAAEQNLMKYKDLKVSYEKLIPLSEDLAKGLGMDTAEAANLLGRSLENPQRAMRLLLQTGVGPDQLKMYQNLSMAGEAAKAQAYLVEILGEKYKGLAKAAFDNDISAQFEIGFKEVKESIGDLIEKGFVRIMPYIKSFMEGIKEVVHWIKEHKDIVEALIGAITAATVVYLIYNAAVKISAWYTGLSTAAIIINTLATEGLTAAMVALDIAMDANPIGIIIIAIAALTAAIIKCYKEFERMRKIVNGVSDQFKGAYYTVKALWDVVNGDWGSAAENIARSFGKINDSFNEKGENRYSGNKENSIESKLVGSKGSKGIKGLSDMEPGNQSDKVTGTKQVVINVSINKLVETIKIMAQNIKDGANQAGPHVAEALLSAVNQFSASTDI